mmetsp:Transcript_6617/g.27506  ORF Transcript_6617/g.27506 Transcript_6617/m.27506 type:complete len:401 (+) Transcript_6617:2170-3372(+)
MAGEQRAQAAALMHDAHQAGHQAQQFAPWLPGHQAGQQGLDAVDAGGELLDGEHQVHRHAMGFEMVGHGQRGGPAAVQQAAQVMQGRAEGFGVARPQRALHGLPGRGQLVEGPVLQQRPVHAHTQRPRQAGRVHMADQHRDGGAHLHAPAVVRCGGEQQAQAAEQLVVDGGDPVFIALVIEQQLEQRGQVAGVGGGRQQPATQPAQGLVPEGHARRKADLGEQRDRVDLMPDPGDDLGERAGVLGVALQHIEQVFEPHHRPRRAGGRLVARRVAQPLQQPHQPQVALGQHGLRIRCVEQRGEVPAQCRLAVSASRNSATSVWNTSQPSVTHRKRPRIVPWGVPIWAQELYWKLWPGASTGWWPTTARPSTTCNWPRASVISQCRPMSWASTSPVFSIVIV